MIQTQKITMLMVACFYCDEGVKQTCGLFHVPKLLTAKYMSQNITKCQSSEHYIHP